MPAGAPGTGYKVSCDASNDGRGNISYCTDAQCLDTSCVSVNFARGDCLRNDPVRDGSASYAVLCPVADALLPPLSAASGGGGGGGSGGGGGGGGGAPAAASPAAGVSSASARPTPLSAAAASGGGGAPAAASPAAGSAAALARPSPLFVSSSPGPAPARSTTPSAAALPAVELSALVSHPSDFRVTWFWEPGCTIAPTFPGPGDFTGVVAAVGFCQAVPRSTDSGYVVQCATDASGARLPRGTFSVCQDFPLCRNCSSVTPFVDEACVGAGGEKAAQAAFGSASAQFQCLNPLLPSALPPPGRALISWYELEACGGNDRSLVDVRLGACNRVPLGADGGYKVECAADGSVGLYSVCDSTCGKCSVATPFATDQCMANPPQFGSASVAIRCPGAVPSSAFGRALPLVAPPTPPQQQQQRGPTPLLGAAPSPSANATTSSGARPLAAAAGLAAATAALVAAALSL